MNTLSVRKKLPPFQVVSLDDLEKKQRRMLAVAVEVSIAAQDLLWVIQGYYPELKKHPKAEKLAAMCNNWTSILFSKEGK